jgi:hypothetical protein
VSKASRQDPDDDLRPEYDFASLSGAVRGKYFRRYRAAANLVLLLGVAAQVGPYSWAEDSKVGAVLRSPDLEPIRSPDRVESLPVQSLLEAQHKDREPTPTSLPGRFRIVPEPMAVPETLVREVTRLFLSPESYTPYYKPCIFDPGVAFRFWKGQAAVDVLVCFHCRDLAFQVVGSPNALAGKLSFDPVASDLARLVRRARPEDPRFKNLH